MAASGYIQKRDGSIAPFDQEKIFNAVWKAVKAVGGENQDPAKKIAEQVLSYIKTIFKNNIPTVENVQDLVEKMVTPRLPRLISFTGRNALKPETWTQSSTKPSPCLTTT